MDVWPTMSSYEIRDPDDARQQILQGLLLSRCAPLSEARVTAALTWAMEIVSDGSPLPPLGFIADVGHVALGALRSAELSPLPEVEGLDHTLTRRYEDYVLGKLYADISFERGSDALLRYTGRDRDRGLAYLINQQRIRCGFGGVILTPAVIKGLLQTPPESVLQQAWQSTVDSGISTRLIDDFECLIAAIRNAGELLGPEDIFELESGTALAEFGQRLALRQVLQTAAILQREIPRQKPRSQPRQYAVATNIMEEDHYPIGGFSSISNRGTMESLVRSELAYIDDAVRPDLFDIKFARNELLYYSRDENQFLRRRLSFVFVLYPDLVASRIKDNHLPCQRVILLLASMTVAVKQLIDWLSGDAIRFEFLFVESSNEQELADERTLIETLLREEVLIGNVAVDSIAAADVPLRCAALARTSLCHTLSIGLHDVPDSDEVSIAARMWLDAAEPTLVFPNDLMLEPQELGIEAWEEQLEKLLRFWV